MTSRLLQNFKGGRALVVIGRSGRPTAPGYLNKPDGLDLLPGVPATDMGSTR